MITMTSSPRDDRAWVATRKGLFELQRSGDAWSIARVSFLGDPVSLVLPPQEDGRMLAALNLGHFGVEVHASDDAGDDRRGDDDRGGGSSQGGEAHGRSTCSDSTRGGPAQQGACTSGNCRAARADFAGASDDAGEFFAVESGSNGFFGNHD